MGIVIEHHHVVAHVRGIAPLRESIRRFTGGEGLMALLQLTRLRLTERQLVGNITHGVEYGLVVAGHRRIEFCSGAVIAGLEALRIEQRQMHARPEPPDDAATIAQHVEATTLKARESRKRSGSEKA